MSSKAEISLEYASLRLPGHCPLGIWVMPCPNDPHTWSGVLFVHKGYYAGGIFRFEIKFSSNYPYGGDYASLPRKKKSNKNSNNDTNRQNDDDDDDGHRSNGNSKRQDRNVPRIYFVSECFHPSINPTNGFFDSSSRFKTWRPHQDFVVHLLHFLKSSFKRTGLEKIILSYDENSAQNKLAFKTYRDQTQVFANLASQSATLSSSSSSLYSSSSTSTSSNPTKSSDKQNDKNPIKSNKTKESEREKDDEELIRFSALSDQEWVEVRSKMLPFINNFNDESFFNSSSNQIKPE